MKRREFIYKSLLAGAGYSFLPKSATFYEPLYAGLSPSTVIQVTRKSVRTGLSYYQDILIDMLDSGLSRLYHTDNPDQIWKKLFDKKDIVGIKVNCLSGEHGSSHKILVDAVVQKLKEADVKSGNIIIWDRMNQDLESAGYHLNTRNRYKVRCFGNDAVGFDNELFMNGSVGSLITRTLTETCTAVINIPVLKDHGIVGVTLSMKNFFGAIHNPNKYHENAGNPYVADLYELDMIRRKTRLTICDALDAQYNGGPPFKPQWSWPMDSLLLAVDGVALDRVGWEIIEQKRHEMDKPSLKQEGRHPEYILTAGIKGLGQADLNRIHWYKIGDNK